MADAPVRPTHTDSRDPFAKMDSGAMAMTVFLISLGALFAATMIGYFIVMWKFASEREVADHMQDGPRVLDAVNLPPLPILLWVSTGVILLSSVTLQWARNAVRKDDQSGLRLGVLLTLILGLVFLVLQTICWYQWKESIQPILDEKESTFAAASFFVLSGVHALHVIGGLIPLLVIAVKTWTGAYTAARQSAIRNITMYWHFLDVVWVVMFICLLLVG
ncbi:MAG: cytochrome c oxidase subunit 3 [Phycisphaerales bacterium]